VVLTKGFKHIQKPPHRQGAGSFEAQKVVFTSECATGPLNIGETFAELSGQNTSGITDLHSRPLAFKELTVEPLFKRPDMPADRARRDIQCFSSFAEGVQARGNFKSAQRIQWR